jgi:hypothetical protein
MRRVSAKFVLRLLSDDQKENRYLAKHQTSVVPHPPYSPSRLLFPKLKTTLKGRRFQTTEDIQESAIREMRTITETAFQEGVQQWKKRWERCIASRGDSVYSAVK